ncbi:hypothetical protein MPSEU_000024300 [Mayamaea pseudoterrestris]|nr:hypothetical protein MPSEU_000024300 [Mayamaea pseudoterrestris]
MASSSTDAAATAATSLSSPNNQLPKLTENVRTLVLTAEAGSVTQHCLVCYSDLIYTSIMPCNHNEICPVCVLRLRFLHHDNKCPICKAEHEQVIVDAQDSSKAFDEYQIWGNELGNDFVYKPNVGMFFPVDYLHKEIQPLLRFPCNHRGCSFDGSLIVSMNANRSQSSFADEEKQKQSAAASSNIVSAKKALRALQDHLRVSHRLVLCNLCTEHPRDFVSRLQRFTPAQLNKHLAKGDGADSGFTGHPVCEFCRPTRFYDLAELHKHLTKNHYKCHVCEQMGMHDQYFRDYSALEKHFDRQHYACHDPQCLAARFVVFAHDIDLADHERQVHNVTSHGKIQLQFRVRRFANNDLNQNNQHVPDNSDFDYGLDGEAFVPAALPASQGELALHPRHVERTAELRVLAAAMRDNMDSSHQEDEAFPTLQASNEEVAVATAQSSQQLRMGWTDGISIKRAARVKPAGAVTVEDFPTLPANIKPKSAKLQVGVNRIGTGRSGSGSNGYNAVAANTAARLATPVASFLAPGQSTSRGVNASSLSSDNFPSLGPSAGPPQPSYSSANALMKKMNSKPLSLSADMFPSLVGNSALAYSSSAKRTNLQPLTKKAPPSFSSEQDFPAPPVSSQPRPKAKMHMANAPTASDVATVEDMKAAMGTIKFKLLKKFTREFVAGELESEAFVDHAASLFDNGYADDYFWSFIPGLVQSCPDHHASAKALSYMDHLKRMRNGALNAEAAHAPTGSSMAAMRNFATSPSLAPSASTIQSGKAKLAWGGINGSSLASAGNKQAGVRNVAANQPNSTRVEANTATMSNVGGAGNKKKKKQNNELKKLAFG